MNKRFIAFLSILSLSVSLPLIPVNAAVKAGSSCKPEGTTSVVGGKTFTCIKSGKKLVWDKGIGVSSSSSISDPPVTSVTSFSALSDCKLKTVVNEGGDLGFPRKDTFIPSIGNIKSYVIFVDFSDVTSDPRQISEWKKNQIPTAEKQFPIMSYGKFNLTFDYAEKFYHLKTKSIDYLLNTPHDSPQNPKANPAALIEDAMTLADPDVDFSKYAFVNVVTPITENILYEGAQGMSGKSFDGKPFYMGTFGPIRQYLDDPYQHNWLVHESGHLLGLIHPFDPWNIQRTYNANFGTFAWDVMAYPLTTAPDLFAWEKFILGWFDENQVNCLTTSNSESMHLITPIGSKSSGTKMVTFKLSSTTALVIESRRISTLDKINSSEEGVLVYKVNVNLGSNKGAVTMLYNNARARNANPNGMAGFGTLQVGEVLNAEGHTIKFIKRGKDGDFVSFN